MAAALDSDSWPLAKQAAMTRLRAAPAEPVANWIVAYASVAAGDYRDAVSRFPQLGTAATGTQLLEWVKPLVESAHTQSPAVSLLYADALLRTERREEALAVLDLALKANPRSALLYDVRGVAKALASDATGAEADFRQAVALDSACADAHYNLGLLALRAGQFAQASEYLTAAIQAAPQYAFPYIGRSLALAKLGKAADAREDRDAAAALLGARAASYLDRPERVAPFLQGRGSTLTASPAVMFMPGANSSKPSKTPGHDFQWQDSSQKVAELAQTSPGEFARPFGATARTGESVKDFEGRLRSYLDRCAAEKKTPFVAMASHLNIEGYAATFVPLPAAQEDKDKDLSWAKQAVPVALKILAEHGFKTDVLCASWGCSTAQVGLAASDIPAGKLTVIAGRADLSQIEALKSSGHVEGLRRITVTGDPLANPRSTAIPGDIHLTSVTGPGGNTGRDPHNFYYYIDPSSKLEWRDRNGNVKSDSASSFFRDSRSSGTSAMSHVQAPPFKESFPALDRIPNQDEIGVRPSGGVGGTAHGDPPSLASRPASSQRGIDSMAAAPKLPQQTAFSPAERGNGVELKKPGSPSIAQRTSPSATPATPASPMRGGVLMTAEVVNESKADLGPMFGVTRAATPEPAWSTGYQVYCPFLAFSAAGDHRAPSPP
jgi:tetratricopeptide (TPR) repeat protein